jgi:hypothetical protein
MRISVTVADIKVINGNVDSDRRRGWGGGIGVFSDRLRITSQPSDPKGKNHLI